MTGDNSLAPAQHTHHLCPSLPQNSGRGVSFNEMVRVSTSNVTCHWSQSVLASSLLDSGSCLSPTTAGPEAPALSSRRAPPGPLPGPRHRARCCPLDSIMTVFSSHVSASPSPYPAPGLPIPLAGAAVPPAALDPRNCSEESSL